jgi:hypothetical protein
MRRSFADAARPRRCRLTPQQRARTPCDGITTFQDLADQKACKPVRVSAGLHPDGQPHPQLGSGCRACNGHTEFQDQVHHTSTNKLFVESYDIFLSPFCSISWPFFFFSWLLLPFFFVFVFFLRAWRVRACACSWAADVQADHGRVHLWLVPVGGAVAQHGPQVRAVPRRPVPEPAQPDGGVAVAERAVGFRELSPPTSIADRTCAAATE